MKRLGSRRIYLDHIRPSDLELLYELFVDPDSGPLFRFSGRTPDPNYLREHLWDGILAQWMVTGVHDGKRRGTVSIASPDFTSGYAYVSGLATAEARRTGLVMEAIGLAVLYAFRTWPFRKLYAEVASPAMSQFASAVGKFCVEEGRLRSHQYHDGAFHDLVVLAIYPEHAARIKGKLQKVIRWIDDETDVATRVSREPQRPELPILGPVLARGASGRTGGV